jgi:hypothetical protein
MKIFMGFFIFACLAFPVFSQTQNQRTDYTELGEPLETEISRSTDMLASFDSWSNNDENTKMYSAFRKRYDDLVIALRESEARMGLLFRTYSRADHVKIERDTYEGLLNELKEVKSNYDNWLSTVQ